MSLRLHIENAVAEIPKEKLLLAQEFARDISCGEWTIYERLTAEAHPAALILTHWWTALHPEAPAGSFMLLEYDSSADSYFRWTNERSLKPIPVETLNKLRDSIARFQNFLLIFIAPMKEFLEVEEGDTLVVSATKKPVHGLRVPHRRLACFRAEGDNGPWYDYAWFQIDALKHIPI